MSELRQRPPNDLFEMFERREGDVRPALPMPTSIRRRIRARRGLAAGAVAVLGALLIVAAVRTLPHAFDSRPAVPAPPSIQLVPTASGHTEIFRWRVLAGPVTDGEVRTQLQTSSLGGGGWFTVKERTFDPTSESFWDTYQLMGPTPQQSISSVLWGFVPDEAASVVIDSGQACDPVSVRREDAVTGPGDGAIRVWGANARCTGPGTVAAVRADGSDLLTPRPFNLTPTDLWAVAVTRAGGIGWILHAFPGEPIALGAGDAGVPNDVVSSIRRTDLESAVIAWREVPEGGDRPFVYGIAANEVDHVVVVFANGDVTPADATVLPGDDFQIFWVQPGSSTPARLVAFDAACGVLANESLNGASAGDPPPGACTPNG
jgi:hypothetical protein